ncbi:BTB/POZ domain-containing protein At3g08570-like isoform X1 [Zingiber officinale]|uniref:BTB/POZ domain-containing protein At3g08570-like isoform X1 n=1 Tax=Zingiber officinale TaxID=94328 RepID=UPI001C4D801A|nr:BTB/POZ domain-containing protein At3g08570-like isoform X1 [Zingiber officinale]XP_042450786.1 BTB/POZ domain-containing protein At3g08570-like isoform X1 [Zingiber officinale]XP_042450794.1 BTB/POZ domain-containing protein At3g08570-like isoform X1 [Zingiber officinale]
MGAMPDTSLLSPRLCAPISRRIFSDVAGDVTIYVDGQSFLLHKVYILKLALQTCLDIVFHNFLFNFCILLSKFPLVSRSGKIWKMVVESREPDLSRLELHEVPGGAEAFELAAKFCYGTNFEITASNVAQLRCIAEYLEMTEHYQERNLIVRAEAFLNEVVFQSLEKSLEVLSSSNGLSPIVDEVGIVNRCIDAIAINASKEQLVSGLAHLECDSRSGKLMMHCQDWWVEDLSVLKIDLYRRVIAAMRRTGVRSDTITQSLLHYAQTSLKGIQKRRQAWEFGLDAGDNQRSVVETLVSLLVTENIKSVPLSFLFGILRMAIEVNANFNCRQELERRIGFRLELASLDDLLIPSSQASDLVFDIDTVHRILVNFLRRIEVEDSEESSHSSNESEGLKSPCHSSVLKVGGLMDGYLAEIAPDPHLKLPKFMAIIELLPEYSRVIDDGLYRAIDIYLKSHPSLMESECKKLCKLIDCQKLSQEASNHAAQNDRLPLQMIVRVLYQEQIRLKSTLSASSGDASFSQRLMSSSSVPSGAVSPRDNYASLRRENRELKLEISRMRVRLSELEKEQAFMKRGMTDNRSGEHSRAFFSSISRGIGKIAMFGPAHGKQRKSSRKSQHSDGKSQRRQRKSAS